MLRTCFDKTIVALQQHQAMFRTLLGSFFLAERLVRSSQKCFGFSNYNKKNPESKYPKKKCLVLKTEAVSVVWLNFTHGALQANGAAAGSVEWLLYAPRQ